MSRFFADMAVNPLLLPGLLAGLLAGISCGVMGPYVITRRIVFLTGAVAHMVIGGVGAVLYLKFAFAPALDSVEPIHGALAAALLAAVIVGLVQHYARENLDTLIGALWAVGMATGILLVKFTRGYQTELMSYLFGNIAVVDWTNFTFLAVLTVVVISVALLWHKRLQAVCIDEEYAALQGVRVLGTNLVLLGMVSLAVVAMIRIVGLILVIALLTLPAAAARHHTRRFGSLIGLSILLCAILTTLPRVAVYGSRIAPESAIVLAAGLVYLISLAVRRAKLRSKPAN